MDPRSAPMLKTFAVATSATATYRTQGGYRRLIEVARPCPVVMPSRAAVSCTAAANGSVTIVIQSSPNPNAAPTCEYVPMPEGSSSAAPVTTAGPNREKYPNPLSR
jgi:hypothetical protein